MDNVSLFFLIFNLHGYSWILDNLMVFGAETLVYFVIFMMVLLTIMGGASERKSLLLAIFSLVISLVIVKIIRMFYFEPRPFITYHLTSLVNRVPDASFPSTHTTRMACIAFAYYFYKSKYALLMLFFLIWMGFARIYVGAHYPLDIIGGFAVGIISTIIALQAKKLLQDKFFRQSL